MQVRWYWLLDFTKNMSCLIMTWAFSYKALDYKVRSARMDYGPSYLGPLPVTSWTSPTFWTRSHRPPSCDLSYSIIRWEISQLFFIDLGTLCALPVKYIPNTLLWFQQSLNAIEKPYSLQQSALVGDHNGRQILGLYHFVSEEFDYNIATYISS